MIDFTKGVVKTVKKGKMFDVSGNDARKHITEEPEVENMDLFL